MTACTAAAEQKGNFFMNVESYFLHFKTRRFKGRKRQCSTILIIQTSTDFPSKSDSPVITA